VIDEQALLRALDSGKLRAGLDVWADEPTEGHGEFSSEVAKHPKVVGTHHIGASTDQAQRSIADGTVAAITAYIAGVPVDCVNLRSDPDGTASLTVRHLDRVGVLAKIFAVLRTDGLNVQQMQNQVFQGGEAAVANINTDRTPSDEAMRSLLAIDEVLSAVITQPSPSDKPGS
jgi:D-3-phosphoglycerate dehydrogenase